MLSYLIFIIKSNYRFGGQPKNYLQCFSVGEQELEQGARQGPLSTLPLDLRC